MAGASCFSYAYFICSYYIYALLPSKWYPLNITFLDSIKCFVIAKNLILILTKNKLNQPLHSHLQPTYFFFHSSSQFTIHLITQLLSELEAKSIQGKVHSITLISPRNYLHPLNLSLISSPSPLTQSPTHYITICGPYHLFDSLPT